MHRGADMKFQTWLEERDSSDSGEISLRDFGRNNADDWFALDDQLQTYSDLIDAKAVAAQKAPLSLALGRAHTLWQGEKTPRRSYGPFSRLLSDLNSARLGLIIFGLAITLFLIILILSPSLLDKLADIDTARGLITFIVALAAIGLFTVYSISLLWHEDFDVMEKRFGSMKELLTILVSILGTILGFYFGSALNEDPGAPPAPPVVEQPIPAADSPS